MPKAGDAEGGMKRRKNWQPKLVPFEHEPMSSESKDASEAS